MLVHTHALAACLQLCGIMREELKIVVHMVAFTHSIAINGCHFTECD